MLGSLFDPEGGGDMFFQNAMLLFKLHGIVVTSMRASSPNLRTTWFLHKICIGFSFASEG
jgi:hypothetical protein